jgi:hypothetical protein
MLRIVVAEEAGTQMWTRRGKTTHEMANKLAEFHQVAAAARRLGSPRARQSHHPSGRGKVII